MPLNAVANQLDLLQLQEIANLQQIMFNSLIHLQQAAGVHKWARHPHNGDPGAASDHISFCTYFGVNFGKVIVDGCVLFGDNVYLPWLQKW